MPISIRFIRLNLEIHPSLLIILFLNSSLNFSAYMKYFLLLILFILAVSSLALKFTAINSISAKPRHASANLINTQGKTLGTRISVPDGFKRINSENNLASYLRNLPVKPHHTPVHLYNGSLKNRQDVHVAIIDMEVGKRDLQQCADAVMRLRAEYLFKQKNYNAIHFNFTSGDRAAFTKYAQGYRPEFTGNKVSWQKKASESYSYSTFRKYMDLVFSYAGTASLEKELIPVAGIRNIKPGDVLIRGGFPGHAVMVVDVALNPKTNEKIYLLSQSYMPAQETHILKNPDNPELSPWYSTAINGSINTPEWSFSKSQLKRFSTW